MKENRININKDIVIWIVLFIFMITTCSAFLRPHYTHDTYKIIRDGYEFYSYDKFLKESRPITAILTILAGKINLPIENYIVGSFILAIAILAVTVVIVYKILKSDKADISNIQKVALILISYIIIFGYLTIEHIFFLEACIMALGILLSILACRMIFNNEKYCWIKAILMLFIGVFCYQGSIAIFPIILLTYYAVIKPLKIKEYVKLTIKAAITYGVLMFLSIIYVKVFFCGSRIQIGAIPIELNNILDSLKYLVIDSLGVIPSYLHIGVILITLIFILFVDNKKIQERFMNCAKYLFIIVSSILICMMPILTASGLELEPRMCMAYGCTIGISLLFMYKTIFNDNIDNRSKINIKRYALYIIIFIIFIFNRIVI